MANVLNRSTLEYRQSVNTPDYTDPPWLFNPDMSPVAGVPHKYWKLTGDTLSEMSSGEKAAVDAAQLTAVRDAAAAQLDQQEDILRAFMLLVLDEFNAHTAKINAILTAVDNAATLAALKTAVAAIADQPTRTEAQLKAAIKAKLGT